MTTLEPHRPKHAILYAMLRWYSRHKEENHPVAPEVVVPQALARQEGPLGAYGEDGVATRVSRLKELGLVRKVTYYGRNIGYILTDEGMEELDRLGTPKHYDH
jgi:repressor of nif and glnA expression